MLDPGERAAEVQFDTVREDYENAAPGYLHGAAFLTLSNHIREQALPVTSAYPTAVFADPTTRHSHRVEHDVRQILVYCGPRLSDYLFALPALDAIRLAYPQAEIVLAGWPRLQHFIENRPGPVDRVETDLNHLGSQSFDLTLMLEKPGSESGQEGEVDVGLRRVRSRLTVGFLQGLDRSLPYFHDQHNIFRNLEAASLIGAEPQGLEPRIIFTEQDRQDSLVLVPETNRKLVILAPGGKDLRRRWPVDKFAAVGRALSWAGVQLILLGSKDDPALESLCSQLPTPTIFLDEEAPLGALADVFNRASLVVANAGETLYLAQAAGSCTLGIYWCADLMASGPLTRSRNRPAISWQLACPECGLDLTRANCSHETSLVSSISQEEVLISALELVNFEGPALQEKADL